jgi:hypothetical protein
MDGRREPDPKPERENEPVDEEIIDLTQVIEGGDNDDIIDLNDILEQPDQASEETDEAAIPLVDVISTEAPADLNDVADDDIIDLEDVATTLEADMADTEPDQEDEAVIDLMDVAALDAPAKDAVTPTAADEEEVTADIDEADDDIIDLEDVATTLEADVADTEPESDVLPSGKVEPAVEPDQEDEAVIDLMDVAALDAPEEDAVTPTTADEEEVTAGIDETDDDIIDLEDVATTLEADMADTEPESGELPADEAEPLTEADQEDEAVIDLMDVAALDAPEEDALAPSAADEEEVTADIDETDVDQAGVIDLTDIEASESDKEEFADLQSRAEAMLTEASGSTVEPAPDPIDEETPEEAAETAGPDADFGVLDENDDLVEPEPVAQPAASVPPFSPETMPESPAAEPIRPTDQQVDAALERVIEKIYSEKIEQMMIQTIEKTVRREIEKIKTALLEDSDGMAG